MKVQFEDEKSNLIYETEKEIFIPVKGDVITLKGNDYTVLFRYVDYDHNEICVDVERWKTPTEKRKVN